MKKVERDSRAWDMGTSTNSRSFELESWSYIQHKDYQLHLLMKAEKLPSNRPTIPATEAERLAFYRGYVTAPSKLQINYMQHYNFSRFYWLYLWNVLLRNLPLNYLHVFLAAYSPDEHLFSSKMIPLCIGVSWQVVICGILQLVYTADILSMLLLYSVFGFIYRSPWNRCRYPYYNQYKFPFPVHCMGTDEFMDLAANYTFIGIKQNFPHLANSTEPMIEFFANYYVLNDPALGKKSPYIQIAPLVYFLRHWVKANVLQYKSYQWIAYFVIIWIGAGAMYKSIFRKLLWKVLKYGQLFNNIVYVLCGIIVMATFIEQKNVKEYTNYRQDVMQWTVDWDFDMIAESITGPPVVQLLTARSIDRQIEPGRDSAMIVVSNAIFYLFRALVNHKIKYYIESRTSVPIRMCWFNPFPIFTFWNIFFDEIFMGGILLRVFYVATFLVEFLVFVITYQIVIEVIVCEWKWAKRWIATILLSLIGLTLNSTLQVEIKRYLYLITSALSSLTEVIVVCWMYPLGRLYDDMAFQFGSMPLAIRKWSLWFMPFYCLYKTYICLMTFQTVREIRENNKRSVNDLKDINEMKLITAMDFSQADYLWVVAVAPVFFGIFYSMIKYMVIQKQNWRVLLKPRPDWGPREHVTRQLRKQFDSRDYVGSQASRYLSRHVLTRAETASYRLDIRYDIGGGRRSTVGQDGFQAVAQRDSE